MTTTILERTVEDVLGDLETNQDTMRILADMGQDLCSQWSSFDTPEDNMRMTERLLVIFNSTQEQLKLYDGLLMECVQLERRVAA
jgi:hypothetical protein